MGAIVLAAVLAATAAALMTPDVAGPGAPGDPVDASVAGGSRGGGWATWRPRGAGIVAGLGLGALVGGAAGLIVGCATALAVPVLVARMEPADVRRERRELRKSAPLVADLLCASLQAGVPVDLAVPVVAHAVGGPAGRLLLTAHRRTQLGQPMESVWTGLASTPGLGGIARAVVRSSRTGAPMSGVLAQAAGDLRAEAAAFDLERVRATAVRAVLPLGLCLLPSFVLLGIVPVVGGLLPSR